VWSANLADAIGATQKKAAVDDRGYSYYGTTPLSARYNLIYI